MRARNVTPTDCCWPNQKQGVFVTFHVNANLYKAKRQYISKLHTVLVGGKFE